MVKNFFKKLNAIDYVVIALIVLIVLGVFFINRAKVSPTAEVLYNKKKIHFDVVLRGKQITGNSDIFKKDEDVFITIRNVPYTKLKIKKAEKTKLEVAIPNIKSPDKALFVEDETAPYAYNYLVTVEDEASITEDGPVIGGNKIKIGLPISLEGFNYRLNGVVSDVRILNK